MGGRGWLEGMEATGGREGLAEEHGAHWRGGGGGGGLLKEHGVYWRGKELAEESTGGGGNECGLGRMCM